MAALYGQRAGLYDIVYQWKDYAGEAVRVRRLLADRGIGPGARVLEAACGTGSYLAQLRDHYDVAGFDLSPDMVDLARRKLPGVPLWQADITEVQPEQVGGVHDAVLCLFSSIGYLFPAERLYRGLAHLAALLRPGGVLILEPWLAPGVYKPGRPSLQTAGLPDLDTDPARLLVARGGVADLREEDGMQISVMRLHYLVMPADGVTQHFEEVHELWLCPPELMQDGLRAAGLTVEHLQTGLASGRGLYLGTRH